MISGAAWSIATANASPWADRGATPMELTPITRPARSTSGPPLFPGLIAASVWISVTLPTCRSALTIPRVTVFESTPSAEPTAMTSWPARAPATEPSRSVGCVGFGFDTCSRARSVPLEMDTTRAV